MPVIQISKIVDQTKTSNKGKKYKVVHIEGTKYGSDEAWTTDIFKNKTDLLEQLEDFGPGELANFKFVQNGNFFDLTEITEPDAEFLAKIKSGEFDGAKPGKAVGGSTSSKGGGWNGRTGEAYDRSAAVYLAFDMIKANTTEANMRKMADEDLFSRTITLACGIYDYIHDGETGFPDADEIFSDDGSLEPPV